MNIVVSKNSEPWEVGWRLNLGCCISQELSHGVMSELGSWMRVSVCVCMCVSDVACDVPRALFCYFRPVLTLAVIFLHECVE